MTIQENLTQQEQLSGQLDNILGQNGSSSSDVTTQQPEGVTDDNSGNANGETVEGQNSPQQAGNDNSTGKADWLDESLSERAQAYGYNDSLASSFGSKEALETNLDFIRDQMSGGMNGAVPQQPPVGYQQQQQVPQQQQNQQQLPTERIEPSYEKFVIESGDEFDSADPMEVLAKMNDFYHDQVISRDQQAAEANMMMQDIIGHIQNEQAIRYTKEMDQRFGSLDGSFSELAGSGDSGSIPQGSPAYMFRSRVAQRMNDVQNMMYARGSNVTEDFAFNEAVRGIAQEMGMQNMNQPVQSQPRTNNGRFMASPNSSNSSVAERTPDQLRDDKLRAYANEHNLPF